jgi:hypothetical protein
MMKFTGKMVYPLFLLMLLPLAHPVKAALTASVDRDRVQMGDTLILTVTATDNERIGNLNPRPLLNDFEILQSSSSSSTSIINGQRTSERKVTLEITPRRTGTVKIPPLSTGDALTNFLIVAVSPQSNQDPVDQTVSFDAELEHDSVYVQGQVILTLRIMQSINLESRSLTDLKMDKAFVKQLEQQSFQRTIKGRPWLIHEIRYAIFPEESGTLDIPAQTFTARESSGKRSSFGFGNAGRQLTRSTKALSLKVLPRPASFAGTTWLPARNVEIQEVWSTPPDQLRTGESATRTIKITGEGLQGAQLPPILFPATEGLKYYPDQPVIEDVDSNTGLTGTRTDSAALIPTREGSWKIPEVRIPWWDTTSGQVRYAVLPEQKIVVTKGADFQLDQAPIAFVGSKDPVAAPVSIVAQQPAQSGVWKLASLALALGWLCTLIYVFYSRRAPKQVEEKQTDNTSEKMAFKQLVAACAAANPAYARREIISWCAALFAEDKIHSLEDVSGAFNDPELSNILSDLNSQLYSGEKLIWDAAKQLDIVKRLRKSRHSSAKSTEPKLALYPD